MMDHTGCSGKIVFFFSRIFIILPPLPFKHWAAIGCTKNFQPIGVTAHSYWKVSYSDLGEEGVASNCEKNTIFPEHPI